MAEEITVGNAATIHNVSNPHPGFGKDPNIANEYGHTVFPKYIQTKAGPKIAEDEDQEAELLKEFGEPDKPEKVEKPVTTKKPAGWGK